MGKLYYKNGYQKECTARILNHKVDSRGLWLQFDNNLFYPGGGGQSPDKGKIDNNDLQEILEDEGIIWHCITGNNTLQDGEEVHLQLDWPVRYQNMQQHSGQHLLSHVLWEKGLRTVSVHLGEINTMIEVEGDFPDDGLLHKVEDEANKLIRKAVPINTFFVDRVQAEALPLRKPAGDWAELRIVEIDGMDYSACGGTHVQNTSEIGLVKYIGSEKIRGHARLKFVIGESAYAYFVQLNNVMNQLKESLQTDPTQFADKLNGLMNDISTLKKENNQLKKYFIKYQCNEIIKKTNVDSKIVISEIADCNFDDIKEIAKVLAGEYQKISFIYGKGRFSLCAPETGLFNTTDFMRKQGQLLGLKGGGPEGFVQGVCAGIREEKIKQMLTENINTK